MKYLALFAGLLACYTYVEAQNPIETPNTFVSLKNFMPPSPEPAALGRYGEIPVGLSSGVPEISVPLYEVKSRKLALPVSLSYHASGIKVEDLASTDGYQIS